MCPTDVVNKRNSVIKYLVDRIAHDIAAGLEASRHFVAPDPETERDEEGSNEDHDAHQAAHEHVDESREKAENKRKSGIWVFV